MKNSYTAIGIMSGTSLDGLDVACVTLTTKGFFSIESASTFPYSELWEEKLRQAPQLSATALLALNAQYGTYIGQACLEFFKQKKIDPASIDFIASHGHTIFHVPANGYTYQLGNGPHIKTVTGITTVCDFRSADVALGGQGAPLVPVGDKDLFAQYDACLNLGGFANISFKHQRERIAFDICPVNYVLNSLAKQLNEPFDAGGNLAKTGKPLPQLLQALNQLEYYRRKPPKSLGAEWVEEQVSPLLASAAAKPQDLLATFTLHSAQQIAKILEHYGLNQVLATGGGVYNQYLLKLVKQFFKGALILPEDNLINYKEALVFAWLGLLRLQEKNNILASVTGANTDHCGGLIY
jgi:anhydro-N-acetylmuramic acid kinase